MAQRDSSYKNVMTGKLQLKGDLLPTMNKPIKKKKRTKKIPAAPVEDLVKFADYKEEQPEGEQEDARDARTPAEIAYEKAQQKRMADMAKRMATKSHREKVEEFNKKLANMSEHYDIPKVGPG